ncbi:hypothetical protein [Streptomyces sasae]|uniref:hypothetical protein n=1 Tax=Streptomyces sasae TaxID=1266772 RepID=UPI002930F4A0|nr:hypothetical protein [Streptomyces sasae]
MAVTLSVAAVAFFGAVEPASADSAVQDFGSIQLDVINNPPNAGGKIFQVCNFGSSAVHIWVELDDSDYAGKPVRLTDTSSGWSTYGAWINFNPGGCEAFKPTVIPDDGLYGAFNDGSQWHYMVPVAYN